MKYRKNNHTPAPNSKEDPVGKMFDASPLHILEFEPKPIWRFANGRSGVIYGSYKLAP